MSFLDAIEKEENYPISFKAVKGIQFGKEVITAEAKLIDIIVVFEVDPDVQRELDFEQVASIRQYILNRLTTKKSPLFFPPFVFSSRGYGKYIEKESAYKLKLENRIAVLDGQHRLEAFRDLANRLKNSECPEERDIYKELIQLPLTLQIYEGLSIEQEQQLFTDVNSTNSKVSANLIKYYDENNPTSKLMREVVKNHPSIAFEKFEVRKNMTRRKLMTGITVYRLIAALHEGKIINNHIDYQFPENEYVELKIKTDLFLNLLVKYMPRDAYDRSKSIYLNQSVVLTLAKVIYLIDDTSNWETFFKNNIFPYDWSHSNKDLHNAGVAYNPKTKRFRLSPEARIINPLTVVFENKIKEEVII